MPPAFPDQNDTDVWILLPFYSAPPELARRQSPPSYKKSLYPAGEAEYRLEKFPMMVSFAATGSALAVAMRSM